MQTYCNVLFDTKASYCMSLKSDQEPKVGIWDGKMFFPLYICNLKNLPQNECCTSNPKRKHGE